MICELTIQDFGSYIDKVYRIAEKQEYRMWYRGQPDYSWGLVPSIQREKDKSHKEQYTTTNFMIQTMRLSHNAPQQYDRAGWLTMMQHYGLPTRLLDWSESPLVALYFALVGSGQKDAAVWVLNPTKLNQKIGYGKCVPPISYESVKMDLEQYDDTPILTDDEMKKQGYSLPPNDMYKKIKWKRIVTIAAIIVILICGVMSVQAVRVYIFKIIDRITDNSMQFMGINEVEQSYDSNDNEAYKTAEEALGVHVLKPMYLPEGFIFDSVKVYPGDYIILIYRNQEKLIRLTQSLLKDNIITSEVVDTDNGHTYTLDINGYDIIVGQHNQEETGITWSKAIWNDDKCKYSIDTNIDDSELEKLILSLE